MLCLGNEINRASHFFNEERVRSSAKYFTNWALLENLLWIIAVSERRITERNLKGLPAYDVRISARSKRARIEVSPFGEVEVVIPKRFDPRRVSHFVSEHQDWLERTLEVVEARRLENPVMYEARPKRISLPAIGRNWQVSYLRKQKAAFKETNTPRRTLSIRFEDEPGARHCLQRWLHEKAQHHLVSRVVEMSDELELPINKVIVRGQKTRWGSCSARKNISINRNLLFLPKYLVDYLFIHELCHTVHLNHSRRYWNFVATFEPEYEALERELTHSYRYVPFWAYPESR